MILQRPQCQAELVAGRVTIGRRWDEALVWAKSIYECVPVAATDPLYILYTSVRPEFQSVVRDNGGRGSRSNGR